jgi:ABC-type proline/glycine betaine transport system substrate-binding protein
MEANDATPEEAARAFLAASDVWQAWVTPEAAAAVRAAL